MGRFWFASAALALTALMARPLDAHKPITSPFTYSTDVRPILEQRCGQCHQPGGVAPMSLLTHADTVPWGESMRGELLSGQMPPWSIDRGAARFRDRGSLTARELNVLLTWLAGGTPPGDGARASVDTPAPGWTLGVPDEIVALPRVTLAADEPERVDEFTLPAVDGVRALRALDLLPGTPALLRSATIEVVRPLANGSGRDERLLSLWVPGDEASPAPAGALRVPARAAVRVRMHYRKTWEVERQEMSDESRLGLYFAPAGTPVIQALPITPREPVTLSRTTRVVAIYPDPALADTSVTVVAALPGGRRQELIAFRPRRGWARRFWLREPLSLPRGTRLTVRATVDSPSLLPPGFTRPAPAPAASPARVYVNFL